MRRHFPRSPSCQLCEFISSKQQLQSNCLRRPIQRTLSLTRPSAFQQKPRVIVKPKPVTVKTNDSSTKDQDNSNQSTNKYATQYNQSQLEANLGKASTIRDKLLSGTVPTEGDILMALTYCDQIADSLIQPAPPVADDGQKPNSASNALLSLEERTSKVGTKKVQATPPFVLSALEQLSRIAFSMVTGSAVYVTPAVLKYYVEIQAKLGKPETFPEVFHLYANKPIPLEGTFPVQYKKQRPNKLANAISKDIVDFALKSAINARQLGVAIDIIENTLATQAYRRLKTLQKVFLPVTAAGLAPIALYTLASQFADFQTSMDNEMATKVAFAGMITYVGLTGFTGFIAVATANDQMDRVTWAPGIPLRYRWLQEDERAAYDKIAGAWGFRERWRRGEEEGEEWEALRECIGMKGMILDRTELMDGME